MAKPMIVTDANFQKEILSAALPSVIDFWAEWCGPCKMIGPVVAELADDYDGKIIVGKVDVDSNSGIAAQYGIRSIPTLLFFKGGELVDQLIGAVPKAKIKEKIDAMV